jgi:hypothetical protein
MYEGHNNEAPKLRITSLYFSKHKIRVRKCVFMHISNSVRMNFFYDDGENSDDSPQNYDTYSKVQHALAILLLALYANMRS